MVLSPQNSIAFMSECGTPKSATLKFDRFGSDKRDSLLILDEETKDTLLKTTLD